MKSKMMILIALTTLVATPTLAQEAPAASRQATAFGHVIGADPDINVRSELLRDAPTYLGNN